MNQLSPKADVLGMSLAATDYPQAIQTLERLAKAGRSGSVAACNTHIIALARQRPDFRTAIRMSAREEGDESNLYISQFREMAKHFASCEVQVFNLLGYPMKTFSDRWSSLARLVQKIDSAIFRAFPRLLQYGANCNIIFTK